MSSFPSYAKIALAGFAEQRESALMRTQMESGPPKQAKVRSRVMINRPVSILLSSLADYQAFVLWFSQTIHEGADWFDFTDPVDGTTKSARFVGGGLDAVPSDSKNAWSIKTNIETWG